MPMKNSSRVKGLGLVLAILTALSLVGTPAQASGTYVPPGGKKCATSLLANVGIYVSPNTKLWITDKNGVVLKETLVAAIALDARLEVCVEVDVNAFVDIGAAVPVDKDGDKYADYVLVKVLALADIDGHAKISAQIKGKVAIFLAVKLFAQLDVNVDLKKGEKYECDTGAGKK